MFDTARLLFYRNIDTVEKAKRFLNSGKKYFNNPLLLDGMQDAVNRLHTAKNQGEKVLIYGDYDADGVCATTVLYKCLKDFGISAYTFVPERELGYGINTEVVQKFVKEDNVSLIITVDCGISDKEKIDDIKALNIDVIVTDHHEPPEILPDCIKIDPKIKGQAYPFTELCGAGVAYKLGFALIGERANDYLDYVALATVADSMDLIDENRDIVVEGLNIFNSDKIRPVFATMLSDNEKEVTAQSLAFAIAPRINAGGRMGDVNSALQLLLTDDQNKIFDLVSKLNSYNLGRQVECERIFTEAKEQIRASGLENDSVILVKNESWKGGFVGIVAAKLVEYYSRPVIVFHLHDGFYKGSARSVEGINIHQAITSCADILIAFGGHSQAAGVSVSQENFEELRRRLCAYVDSVGAEIGQAVCNAEWQVNCPIDVSFAREINLLEPFGTGNRRPAFTCVVNGVGSSPLKPGSPHCLVNSDAGEMLYFNFGQDVEYLNLPIDTTIVFEWNLSRFRGKDSLKGFVKKLIANFDDFNSLKSYAFRNELTSMRTGASLETSSDKNLVNGANITYLNHQQITIENGVRTLYVLTDSDNIKFYDIPNEMPRFYGTVTSVSFANCIVVAPLSIPAGYNKIVYLDKPYFVRDFNGEIVICSDLIGYQALDSVNVEREKMAEIFNYLCAVTNKEFSGSVEFYNSKNPPFDKSAFIFATEVFLELGFFYIEYGVLKRNSAITNPLTNSKVYSTISLIKG